MLSIIKFSDFIRIFLALCLFRPGYKVKLHWVPSSSKGPMASVMSILVEMVLQKREGFLMTLINLASS